MTGIEFLVIVAIILIVLIIAIFIFNTCIFINLKSYHKSWEPIYKNRIEHFDKYLNYALDNRRDDETIESIALFAATMRYHDNVKEDEIDEKFGKDFYINARKDMYLYELRSANIE